MERFNNKAQRATVFKNKIQCYLFFQFWIEQNRERNQWPYHTSHNTGKHTVNMGKSGGGFLTPKAIANRIKAKGLQKLRWYIIYMLFAFFLFFSELISLCCYVRKIFSYPDSYDFICQIGIVRLAKNNAGMPMDLNVIV